MFPASSELSGHFVEHCLNLHRTSTTQLIAMFSLGSTLLKENVTILCVFDPFPMFSGEYRNILNSTKKLRLWNLV